MVYCCWLRRGEKAQPPVLHRYVLYVLPCVPIVRLLLPLHRRHATDASVLPYCATRIKSVVGSGKIRNRQHVNPKPFSLPKISWILFDKQTNNLVIPSRTAHHSQYHSPIAFIPFPEHSRHPVSTNRLTNVESPSEPLGPRSGGNLVISPHTKSEPVSRVSLERGTYAVIMTEDTALPDWDKTGEAIKVFCDSLSWLLKEAFDRLANLESRARDIENQLEAARVGNGVGNPWTSFENRLADVEHRLSDANCRGDLVDNQLTGIQTTVDDPSYNLRSRLGTTDLTIRERR